MTFSEFISRFDHENSIVLLEGKRNVLPADTEKLIALGRLLATNTRQIIFRSGNAAGADQLFSDGVVSVNAERLQVVTPYSGHRKKTNVAFQTYSLEEMDLAAEPEVVYHARGNKKMEKLIDQYVAGDRNQYAMKAAYILRDTVKVVGASGIRPASIGIFYDDLLEPMSGGTGHTMQVCENNGIPLLDQRTWFEWLK
ncbi:MAG: hypothetical protein RLZ62_2047 [Bacteroidota bacterium]|jgi:hypothetical protein